MNQLAKVDEYRAVVVNVLDLGVEYGLNLFSAVAILIAGFLLAGWASKMVRRRLEKISRFDQTLIPILAQITRYAILVFTIILVLAEFGIQTASIITVLGAAGLAIGLALQGTLQNVAAGLMLLFIRPFKVGDVVECAAGTGTVDEIGMFMTRMHTAQGLYIVVPNSNIWSESIINYSARPSRRIDLLIGISYDDDIDEARKVILGLALQDERVVNSPEPIVVVKNLGDSSVDLELRAWVRRQDYWTVRFELTRAAKYALDEAGISIPYPHMQVVSVQG